MNRIMLKLVANKIAHEDDQPEKSKLLESVISSLPNTLGNVREKKYSKVKKWTPPGIKAKGRRAAKRKVKKTFDGLKSMVCIFVGLFAANYLIP